MLATRARQAVAHAMQRVSAKNEAAAVESRNNGDRLLGASRLSERSVSMGIDKNANADGNRQQDLGKSSPQREGNIGQDKKAVKVLSSNQVRCNARAKRESEPKERNTLRA